MVQKHAATHLHYDFRLELDGVLKSWAVPKGPSLDPAHRALAVRVEDHPVAYGSFEGTIPKGQYGGGTVEIWDRGRWEPEGDAAAALERGKLSFTLYGDKLRGRWTLVRMGKGKNWLLMKGRDEFAVPGSDVGAIEEWKGKPARREEAAKKREKRSAAKAAHEGGRQRGAGPADAEAAGLTGARRAAMPEEMGAQLAEAEPAPPEGEEWLHETKFDGYRLLAFKQGGAVRLITRRGHDWTHRFKGIAKAVGALPIGDATIDGEAVILRPDGSSDFQALQNVMNSTARGRPVYMVFDLPWYGGYDLTRSPLAERKGLLEKLIGEGGEEVRYSAHVEGRGPMVYRRACAAGMEGIVSKRARSPYTAGRSGSWLKVKCVFRQEFVVGGYTDPMGSRVGLGALLVGYYKGKKLVYAGKVGTGFNAESLAMLLARLGPLGVRKSPFADPPRGAEARGVHWTRPELVAEIEFGGWTGDESLRHPSFQGLREDKEAKEVVRERGPAKMRDGAKVARPAAAGGGNVPKSGKSSDRLWVGGRDVKVTNLGKVLYPAAGFTKGEVIEYYSRVAATMLPHLADRAISLKRYPDGVEGEAFFQKNCPAQRPEWLPTTRMPTRRGRAISLCGAGDAAGLVWLANLAALELHTHLWKSGDPQTPTMVVFDLDPGAGVDVVECARVALAMRRGLEGVGLESLAKTSGSKGIHLLIPLNTPGVTFAQTKAFARAIAGAVERREPGRITTNMSRASRPGKVFIDWSQNDQHKTTVCVYSLRGRERPTVSTPLSWREVESAVKRGAAGALAFEAPEVLERVERSGDLAAPLLGLRQELPALRGEAPGRGAGDASRGSRRAEPSGPRGASRGGRVRRGSAGRA